MRAVRYVGAKVSIDPREQTLEGERDEICGIGQTRAANDLCVYMPAYRRGAAVRAGAESESQRTSTTSAAVRRNLSGRGQAGAYWASR
jgi:hypothetical protein